MPTDKERERQTDYFVKSDNPNELVRTSFLIKREQNQALANIKAKTHESKSKFVREAIKEYFENHEKDYFDNISDRDI